MSPISLVLHGIISAKDLREHSASIAESFAERTDLDLEFLVRDIDRELQTPRQKVTEILDCGHSEETVRKFLRDVSDRLKNSMQKRTT